MTGTKRGSTRTAGAAAAALGIFSMGGVLLIPGLSAEETSRAAAAPGAGNVLPTVPEAKVRAKLLYAALSGSLQVMHRDFFRKGTSRTIPSESLEDVFKTLQEEQGVTLRWLADGATAMNTGHLPRDAFEKEALKSITGGKEEVITVANGVLRFAGAVALHNECLKCHVPHRTSLEDRFAALAISMPVAAPLR